MIRRSRGTLPGGMWKWRSGLSAGWKIAVAMDSRLKRHYGKDCCLSNRRKVGWGSGRMVGWLSGRRRMEASFEVVGMVMACLTGRRMRASSGARYESYWTSCPGFAERRSSCSAYLGQFPRWDQEH